jgi:hypothetical protein
MEAVDIMEAALVPMVIISAVGLLSLSVQQRYGRVIDRIRIFHEQMVRNTGKEWHRIMNEQRAILIDRGRLLRNSLSFLLIACLWALLATLFISVEIITSVDALAAAVIACFGLSLSSLFVALVFAAKEIFISYTAVLKEDASIGKT